jgi:hypothetical protein
VVYNKAAWKLSDCSVGEERQRGIYFTDGGEGMKAYKKEVQFTIWMTVLFILAGNVGLIFSIFPTDAVFLGFPVKYILPILMGWFGVFLLTIIAGIIGNRIDDEIEAENDSLENSRETEGV